MVLPGKRDFVFTQSVITGYMPPVETCTNQYSYCASDDKYCDLLPTTSCTTYREPIIQKIQSNKISLQLKASHKYDFSITNSIKHIAWDKASSEYTGQVTIFISVNPRQVSDVKETFKLI